MIKAISQLFRIRANAIERSDQPILDLTPQVLDFNHTFNPQQILDRLRQQVEVHEKLLTNLIRTSDEMNQFQTFGNKIGICFNCLGVLFLFLGSFILFISTFLLLLLFISISLNFWIKDS